ERVPRLVLVAEREGCADDRDHGGAHQGFLIAASPDAAIVVGNAVIDAQWAAACERALARQPGAHDSEQEAQCNAHGENSVTSRNLPGRAGDFALRNFGMALFFVTRVVRTHGSLSDR